MTSLILLNNKNRIVNINNIINFKWNISKRNYSNLNLTLNINHLNGFIILSKPSQNFDTYTQNYNIINYSYRNYSNNNKNDIYKEDSSSSFSSQNNLNDINDILRDSININDVSHPHLNNIIIEKQEHIEKNDAILNNNQHVDIPKVEKNSNSFFKRLFKMNKKEGKQEIKIETKTEINVNEKFTMSPSSLSQQQQQQQQQQQTISTIPDIKDNETINNSTLNNVNITPTIKIDNNPSETINEVKINPIQENINIKEKIPIIENSVYTNASITTSNKETVKKENEESGFLGWMSTLLHGKHKNEQEQINTNVNIKKEETIQNNNINLNTATRTTTTTTTTTTTSTTTTSTTTGATTSTSTTTDNNTQQQQSNININNTVSASKPNKDLEIPLNIIINNEKENKNSRHLIKNWKNWFNRKKQPKNKNQLSTMDNNELTDLNDEYSIETELRDILNDSTVGSVENIINNATKGILLPTKNPLTEPPKDTFSFKFNKLCHRINQYFFPLSKKMDETKLSSSMKLINKFTKTSLDARRIVILGVHGWFPKRSIQKMVGDPTGTSVKFCQEMAYSVITFFNDLGMEISNENVIQIPLSGEGIVENRVDNLYKQLEKRMDEVRSADIVLVSAHSQGTPVSVFILNRLLENKEIDPERQTIGMLAMAGIHHGPFPIMRENFIVKFVFNNNDENDVAKASGEELFEFNDPHEKITKYYHAALFNVLNSGVRICAVASWFDQVVPLYSATLQGINHPNLYRAIYVERRDYNDDFFTCLIDFVMKLRNRGISDFGLLVHLSDLIMGSFVYGTQGHSTIYESDNVYKLLLSWITTTKASNKRIPYNEFFDPKQLCGIEDDKEEESYTFEPVTYSISSDFTTSSETTTTKSTKTTSNTDTLPSLSSHQKKEKEIPKLESTIPFTTTSSTPSSNNNMTTTLTTDTTTTSTTATTKSSKTRISSNSISLNENPSKKETPLVISTHHQYQKERMNQTIGNEPPEIAKNMEMSKFKALHKLDVILEQLQSKRIRRFKSPKTLNTYYIPWIISNFQNSTDIKNDPELKEDLKHLMMKYKEWNPKSKSFKLLKHRLAPIQEIFRMAGITFTLEDQIKLNQQKQQRQQQQEQQQQEQTQLKHSMNFEDEQNALQEINSILYKEGKA